jgi:hypothetical protein
MPGLREFEDFLTGGKVSEQWNQTIGGVGSLTYNYLTIGGGATVSYPAAGFNTGTVSGEEVTLDFGGVGACDISHAPVLHATVRTTSSTSDRKVFVGLWQDPDNYIAFEIDPAVYGDVSWRMVTNSGGTKTVNTTLTGSSGRVSWISIICLSASSIEFRLGLVADNNNDCVNGTLNQEDSTNGDIQTISTNIPAGKLEPRISCETQSASSKFLQMFDMQFSSSLSPLF